jgi:hypothetical protein
MLPQVVGNQDHRVLLHFVFNIDKELHILGHSVIAEFLVRSVNGEVAPKLLLDEDCAFALQSKFIPWLGDI